VIDIMLPKQICQVEWQTNKYEKMGAHKIRSINLEGILKEEQAKDPHNNFLDVVVRRLSNLMGEQMLPDLVEEFYLEMSLTIRTREDEKKPDKINGGVSDGENTNHQKDSFQTGKERTSQDS
jgi:hypothetical protein